MWKLEKQVKLYKNQFDRFLHEKYGDYRLDRASLDLDNLLYRIQYMIEHGYDLDQVPVLKEKFVAGTISFRKIFESFLSDFLFTMVPLPSDAYGPFDLEDILCVDVNMDNTYVTFRIMVVSENQQFLHDLEAAIPEDVLNIYPNDYFRFTTDSYNDGIAKAYPELFEKKINPNAGTGDDQEVFVHNVTIQTNEDCSLQCSYCFGRDTPILMEGWKEKPIKDVKVGDRIISIPEHMSNDDHEYYDSDYYESYTVTKVFHRRANCIKVVFKETLDELYITPDHPILLCDGSYWKFIDWWHADSQDDKSKWAPGCPVFMSAEGYGSNYHSWELEVDETPIEMDVYNLETESHTYVAWNMVVHNCYQFNKCPAHMDFETAKLFIDHLLHDDYGYVNRHNSPAIILEFIGGEPLLQIKLIRKIYEYFLEQCYQLNHPWFAMHRVSLCSNGMQYFDDEVQAFFQKHSHHVSFNISIDGNKELHDTCRRQPNGEGSYDIDMVALNHYATHYVPDRNSKMTLAPPNIHYLFESVKDFIDKGMTVINLNCVFEEGWNKNTARIEYDQLCQLSDYLIENHLENRYISIFQDTQEGPSEPLEDGTFCFRGDQQVLTIEGSRDVKSLIPGQKVYTASGSINEVIANKSYKSNSNKKINVSGAFPIYVTPDHKLFASIHVGFDQYTPPAFYPAYKLKRNDLLALPIFRLPPRLIDPRFTAAMGHLLGVYIASGEINELNVSLYPKETGNKFYHDLLTNVGLKFRVATNDTSMVFVIDRDLGPINDYFYDICNKTHYLVEFRTIPRIVFNSPKEVVMEVIYGFVAASPLSVQKPGKKYSADMIRITTENRHLANDLLTLLRACGQYPTCSANTKREGETVIFQGKLKKLSAQYDIYFNPKNQNAGKRFKIDQVYGMMWGSIRSVDATGPFDVYCPTVEPLYRGLPEEHTINVQCAAAKNCGGSSASMLSMRPNGDFYPCIRYMPSSVGENAESMCIGNVSQGLQGRAEGSTVIKQLDRNTRRSRMNDICWECPIGKSCADCGALGCTVFGSPMKRVNFICIQKIAEHLANVYYWNKLRLAHPEYQITPRLIVIPDRWAHLVVTEEELTELKRLSMA